MLPNRGRCHGVFLLSRTATLRQRGDLDEWLHAARSRSTFMAHALNLDQIASGMVQLGLASIRDRVVLVDALAELSDQADRSTLVAIARILFIAAPPFWLNLAVGSGHVSREYIPTSDLEALQWLEPELDQFLIACHAAASLCGQDAFSKRIGDAAEILVVAGLKHSGANPVHVAKLSNTYGYDIECLGERIDRIEVKAASINTQESFHISRNEFDKSVIYAKEWRLVQVVFSNHAFVADRLDSSHVDQIRELRFGALRKFVTPDTPAFRWTESALITVPSEYWHSSGITLDPGFVTDGFRKAIPRT